MKTVMRTKLVYRGPRPKKKLITQLDRDKKKVPFLLQYICGNYYTIKDNKKQKIFTIIGRRPFKKWSKENEYLTDF